MLAVAPTRTSPRQRRALAPFTPLSWQIAPWRDKAPTLLLTGSAGGGKSRLAAEKLHGFCLKYPGAMALMLRKARESMTNATTLFVERKVIGADSRVRHYPSKHRFEYANGSVLAYGGMKDDEQRQQIRSIGQDGGIDIGWLEEATAFGEPDFNELLPRLRGKAAPWRQLILTTNPDSPAHWIYRRLIQGEEAVVYYSNAADNPYNPDDYQATLARLTGVEKQRLADGEWVQASGLVYDVWSDTENVTEAADYVPGAGPVVYAVDDGYVGSVDPVTGYFTEQSHPRVFLLCQLRPNGQLCVFAESYAIKTLSDQHIRDVLAQPYPVADYAAVDRSAAELRGRLHAAEIYTRKGPGDVEESIKELRRWIAPDENGVRRFLVHPRCKHLRVEFASYRRDDVTGKPIKEWDHGCDAARYLCWVLRYD